MRKFKDNKKIYIDQWLDAKPYATPAPSDNYYLKLCNKIRKTIPLFHKNDRLSWYLNDEEINQLACLITGYFEDIISETNIWNTFVKLQKQLHGKPLAFYDVEAYEENEINQQDVQFLIWYMMNLNNDMEYIDPTYRLISTVAEVVMEILEDEWEYAPENTHLAPYYQLEEGENLFFRARDMMKNILFSTYLFYPDTGISLTHTMAATVEELTEKMEGISYEHASVLLYETEINAIFNSHTSLLGLNAQKWVAEILGEEHLYYEHITQITPRVTGWFFFKKQDEQIIYLEHIASGIEFNVFKDSLDPKNEAGVRGGMVYTNIVGFDGGWWVSGLYSESPIDKKRVKEEKRSIKSISDIDFLRGNDEKVQEILDKHQRIFRKMADGELLAFMPYEKVDGFLNSHAKLLQKVGDASEEKTDKAVEEARQKGFNEKGIFDLGSQPEEVDSVTVFFNPKGGIEQIYDLGSAFPMPQNPYYDELESEGDFFSVLMDEDLSTELALLVTELCKGKLPLLEEENGKRILENLDFLLRFWKKGEYQTKPRMSLVDDTFSFM